MHAERRSGFGTRALAAQLSVCAVSRTSIPRLHISPARPAHVQLRDSSQARARSLPT